MQEYLTFAHKIRRKTRYFFDEGADAYLSMIRQTSEQRKVVWAEGKELWRAQLGCRLKQEARIRSAPEYDDALATHLPFEAERMVPRIDKTTEGRVNPKGIPCLYLATEPSTAMSEVRPSQNDRVSIASFTLTRDLTLIDCSRSNQRPKKNILDPNKAADAIMWFDIDVAFSEPVSFIDQLEVANYAPTQVLAALFCRHGYKGIVYSSALGTGQNVALFNIEDAKINEQSLSLFVAGPVRQTFSPFRGNVTF